jgi:hypothetical protein
LITFKFWVGTAPKTTFGSERVAFDIFDCSGTPIGEAWGG